MLARRYDLSCVDALEAFAAEGLAVFSGRLPDRTAAKHLQELVLAAMKTSLGFKGGCKVCCTVLKSCFSVRSDSAKQSGITVSCVPHYQCLYDVVADGNGLLCGQAVQWFHRLRPLCAFAGGLPTHLFTSLGAAQETRLATAAAQQPMPLMRRSMDEAAALVAGLLKAFEREVADTQLLMVPQVGVTESVLSTSGAVSCMRSCLLHSCCVQLLALHCRVLVGPANVGAA